MSNVTTPTTSNSSAPHSESVKPVYIIYSQWSLPEIREFIEQRAAEGETVGTMRVEYSKGMETNRTLVLMSESLFSRLCQEGFDTQNREDFVIKRYRMISVPDSNNKTLFVRLPELTGSCCRQQLEGKLDEMVYFSIIPPGSYQIRIPLLSRQQDIHKRVGFIAFQENVASEDINFVRIILNGINWENNDGDPHPERIKCYWARPAMPKTTSMSTQSSDGHSGQSGRGSRDGRSNRSKRTFRPPSSINTSTGSGSSTRYDPSSPTPTTTDSDHESGTNSN